MGPLYFSMGIFSSHFSGLGSSLCSQPVLFSPVRVLFPLPRASCIAYMGLNRGYCFPELLSTRCPAPPPSDSAHQSQGSDFAPWNGSALSSGTLKLEQILPGFFSGAPLTPCFLAEPEFSQLIYLPPHIPTSSQPRTSHPQVQWVQPLQPTDTLLLANKK